MHFGLGPAARVDKLEVIWPSGIRQTLMGVNADQTLTVRENDADLDPVIVDGPRPGQP